MQENPSDSYAQCIVLAFMYIANHSEIKCLGIKVVTGCSLVPRLFLAEERAWVRGYAWCMYDVENSLIYNGSCVADPIRLAI